MPDYVDTLVTKYTMDPTSYERGADRVARASGRAASGMNGFKQAFMGGGPGGTGGFTGAFRFAVAELDSAIPILQDVVSLLKFAGIAAGVAGAAIAGFSILAMRQAAEFEALELSLSNYVTSVEELDTAMRRLRDISRLPGLGFEETIQGSVRLQAAGLDARLAERAMLGFGNALAQVGGGKAELDGVLLALTQIASKSTVSAEEINQIAERVPQIRQIMLDVFGTANTEELAKRGITPEQFILKIVDALELMPRVAGGSKNAFENFTDSIKIGIVKIGDVLNSYLLPELDKVSKYIDYLSDSDTLTKIADNLVQSVSGGVDDLGKHVAGAVEQTFDTIIESWTKHGAFGMFADLGKFLSEGEGLGDTLVRAGAIITAAFERLPSIIEVMAMAARDFAVMITGFIDSIIEKVNAIIRMINEGIEVDGPGPLNFKIGGLQGDKQIPMFQLIGEGGGVGGLSPETKKAMDDLAGGLAESAKKHYEDSLKDPEDSGVFTDPNKGGFRRSAASILGQIEKNTRDTAENTRPEIDKRIVGGGVLGGFGLTSVELAKGPRRRGGSPRGTDPWERAFQALRDAVNSTIDDYGISEARRSLRV